MLLISIPFVQTQLGKQVTNSLNRKFNTKINIDKVGFSLFGPSVALKGVYIQDHHNDTLAFIGSLNTSISDLKKIQNGDLHLNKISLDNLDLIIKNYKNEIDTNLDVFIDHFIDKNSIDKKTPSTFYLNAKNVEIQNSRFRFINSNLENSKILDFKKLDIFGENLEINGPNVNVSIVDANMLDFRGVNIKSLKTDFSYSLSKMTFEKIKLNTNNSSIVGNLNFNYKRSDFSDFNNKVKLDASFKNSIISFTDLNFFTEIFGNGSAKFSTNIEGTFNDMKMSNFNLQTLNNTKINSNLKFENLLSKDQPFKLIANIDNLTSTYTDLGKMLPDLLGKRLPSFLRNLGVFSTDGHFVVSKDDIDIDAKLNSVLGTVKPKLLFSNLTNPNKVSYAGNVSFERFNLGKLLDNNSFGNTTVNLDLKGEGFDLENVKTKLKTKVKTIKLNNYIFKNIEVNTEINNKILLCELFSNDQNLKGNVIGEIDMTKQMNNYKFKSQIDLANLKKIKIVDRDSIANFKGLIDVNMIGKSINDLQGEINFNKINYTNEDKSFIIDEFTVKSRFNDKNIRTISFNALNFLSGNVEGKFNIEELISLAKNDLGIIYMNYTPLKVSKDQFLNFKFNITNNFTQLFYPDLEIEETLKLNGKISSNEEDFKLNLKSKKLIFQKNEFKNVNLKLDNSNPFYNAYIKIDDRKTKYYDLSDFNLVNKTISDTLFFRTEFKGGDKMSDEFKLNLFIADDINKKTVLGFKKSNLKINEYDWFINESRNKNSKLVFGKNFKNISLSDFKISHKDEFINLFGSIEGDNKKDINLEVNKVILSKLLPKIKHFDFKGIANGNLRVKQDKDGFKPIADFSLKDFSINDI